MPNTVQGDSGISNLWDRSRVIFYEPAVHTGGIQDAIDEAEALAGADDAYGVAVMLPPGDYSAQNLAISKSIALIGVSPGATLQYPTRVGTVTVKPLTTVSATAFVRLLNVHSSGSLDVSNEVLGAPGTYNDNSPYVEMEQSSFNITARGIARFTLTDCNLSARVNVFTVCEDVHLFNCNQAAVEWHSDDSAAGLPFNYSGGNLNFKNCSQVAVDLYKDVGGAVTAYFDSRDTDFESITQNGDTDIRVVGGSVQTLTQLNANNNFLDYQAYAPYTPAVPGDWNVVPKLVQEALDECAARLTAGML